MSDELPIYLDENEVTEEKIRNRMLVAIPDDVDKSEGSYAWDAVAPVAMELVFVAMMAQEVLEMGFAQTATGKYLIMRAEEHGVIQRPATKSVGTVKVTGEPGSMVPEDLQFATEADEMSGEISIKFRVTQNIYLDENGVGIVPIEAVEAGQQGNVPSGTIVVVMNTRKNISAVVNEDAVSGGVDIEDDETLRKRYLEKVRNPGTSGNIADYRQWAMEVSGVTAVHVIPLWNGPGTVKIVILGPDKKPPSSTLVLAVQEYISPTTSGERKAPIGADVVVVAAEMVLINVTATIVLDSTVNISLPEIRETFTAVLSSYLGNMAFQSDVIRIARIGSLLIEQTGVIDYIDLSINNVESNIEVTQEQAATVGTVTIYAQ